MRIENTSTRRDFLGGRSASKDTHIASVLVQAWPEKMSGIEREINEIPGVETHATKVPGKLIVIIETENGAGLMGAMDRIGEADGVITASLIYHHMEDLGDER
jgi:nitrate reductase NapD